MKKKTLVCIALAVLVLLPSCNGRMDDKTDEPDAFTIEEAKALFEKTVPNRSTRGDQTAKNRSRLSPGEFTPIWEEAGCEDRAGIVSYVIPIDGEYRLYSHGGRYGQKAQRPWRRVRQELLVSKNLATGSVDVSLKSNRFTSTRLLSALWTILLQ